MKPMRGVALSLLAGLALGLAVMAAQRGGPERHLYPIDSGAAAPVASRAVPPPPARVPRTGPALESSEAAGDAAGGAVVTSLDTDEAPTAEDAIADFLSGVGPDPGFVPASHLPGNAMHALIAAGFSADEADAILRRERELSVAAASRELEATGTVRPFNTGRREQSAAALRAELGDGDYARYLDAMGLPSRVVVGAVEPDSPAAYAGLEPGDKVLEYAGQRVFNLRDLETLARDGTPGEIVPLTVSRDGQTLRLYAARGPSGVSSPARLSPEDSPLP